MDVPVVVELVSHYSECHMLAATIPLEGAPSMTETPSLLNLSNPAHPANRLATLIKFGVLAVSVAAAIPTARNLYFSWTQGVPFNQVEHRLNQAALLEKNFDCKIDYRAINSTASSRVEVGSCQKTGDISIRVVSGKQINYEWIAFDQLPKPAHNLAGLFNLFVSQAMADEAGSARADGSFQVADDLTVLCQKKVGDNVVRIVQSGNQCTRETMSIFRGAVESSTPVPCSSACPIR